MLEGVDVGTQCALVDFVGSGGGVFGATCGDGDGAAADAFAQACFELGFEALELLGEADVGLEVLVVE